MASILILDDDTYFRKLAVANLHARKHVVFEATRASEADALLAARKFDCIIVDGLLPDVDGMTWIDRLRQKDKETPIVFVSAFWRNDQKVRNLKVSAALKKPVTAGQLVAKVERALQITEPLSVASVAEPSAEMAKLTASFERELPKLVRGIIDAVEQLRRTPDSLPIRGVAKRRAHQLAGTAGSFGFASLGDACAQLEEALMGLAQRSDDPLSWVVIDAALDELLQAPVPGSAALSA